MPSQRISLTKLVSLRDNLLTAYTEISLTPLEEYSLQDRQAVYQRKEDLWKQIDKIERKISLLDPCTKSTGYNIARFDQPSTKIICPEETETPATTTTTATETSGANQAIIDNALPAAADGDGVPITVSTAAGGSGSPVTVLVKSTLGTPEADEIHVKEGASDSSTRDNLKNAINGTSDTAVATYGSSAGDTENGIAGVIATSGSGTDTIKLTSVSVGTDASITIGTPTGAWTPSPQTVSGTTTQGSGATATATVAGTAVTTITVTAEGESYESTPDVTITGGGGSGAEAVALVSATGTVENVIITDGGTGYTSVPDVTITAADPAEDVTTGSGAAANCGLNSSGEVETITITNGGGGYTASPVVTITGDGTGAEAIATISTSGVVNSVIVTAGGSGYSTAPTCTITENVEESSSPNATATATIETETVVTSITVTDGGSGYTSEPTVEITGGGGSGATGTAVLSSGEVASITITNAGTSFTSDPTITLTGGGGSGGTATCGTGSTGVVSEVTITNAGTNYTETPDITLTGGGGSGAAGTAVLTGGTVTGVTITNAGTDYTSAPTVSIETPAEASNEATGSEGFITWDLQVSHASTNTQGDLLLTSSSTNEGVVANSVHTYDPTAAGYFEFQFSADNGDVTVYNSEEEWILSFWSIEYGTTPSSIIQHNVPAQLSDVQINDQYLFLGDGDPAHEDDIGESYYITHTYTSNDNVKVVRPSGTFFYTEFQNIASLQNLILFSFQFVGDPFCHKLNVDNGWRYRIGVNSSGEWYVDRNTRGNGSGSWSQVEVFDDIASGSPVSLKVSRMTEDEDEIAEAQTSGF